MTPKSEAERLIRESLLRGEPVHDSVAQASAALAIAYHDDDAAGTAMSNDLTTHYAILYDNNPKGLAKWQARRKVCFNLLRPIASALCSEYDDPVRYVWSEKDDPKGLWAGLFSEFRDEHVAAMADASLYGWLGGTSGVRPLVTEDKGPLRYALYTREQMECTPDPIDPAVPGQLVVSWTNSGGASQTVTKHHWTDDGFFKTVDGKAHFDEWEEKAYPGGRHPYGIIPVILIHNRRPRWSCFDLAPMDLVNMNRAINKKATDLDWRMTLAGDILVTQGFQPTEGAKAPVVGPGAWIEHGENGSASFIGPDPRVADAISTINEYLGKALMSRRIPENAIMARQSGESGIKVVADSASLAGFRKQRVNVIRPREIELIRLALFVYAMHHGKRVARLEDVPAPSIFYTIPQAPMSADRRADWDRRIRLNLATPVDELLDLEPSLSRKEAEERITANAEYNTAAGLAQMPGFDGGAGADDPGAQPSLEGEQPPAQGGAAAAAAATGDVQREALNGTQLEAAKATLIDVGSGALSKPAAIALLRMAFPLEDPGAIAAMVEAQEVKEPEPVPDQLKPFAGKKPAGKAGAKGANDDQVDDEGADDAE